MIKKFFALFFLYYLRFWARLRLHLFPFQHIIAVTGSAGKTSTRQAIFTILNSQFSTKQAQHANSESGLPLNILDIHLPDYSLWSWLKAFILAPFKAFLPHHFTHYVVEMGIDSPFPPKNMTYLLSIIQPDIGVLLNASTVHTFNFDSLVKDKNPHTRRQQLIHLIAQEKGKLLTSLSPSQTAILNLDRQELAFLIPHIEAHLLTFGRHKEATLRIKSARNLKSGFKLIVTYKNQSYSLQFNFPLDTNYAYTFSAALTVALALHIPLPQAIASLQTHFTLPPGRWSLFSGIKDSLIIDSSYNASPLTMYQALRTFSHLAKNYPKIVVLGDMRELGLQAKQAHKDLADWIKQYADTAYLFGPLTKQYTLPILQQQNFPVFHFKTINNLITHLQAHLPHKAYILVKASQNTLFLERVTAALLKDPHDISKLPRRGVYWDKIRAQTP